MRNHAHIKTVYTLYSTCSISKPIFIVHFTSLVGEKEGKEMIVKEMLTLLPHLYSEAHSHKL